MIELPTTKAPPKRRDPRLLTIFGPSKIGKTSLLAELENCLIIDTEHGTETHSVSGVVIESLADLREVSTALDAKLAQGFRYDYIALDTIDNIADWAEAKVVYDYNNPKGAKKPVPQAVTVGDIPYGAGYGAQRELVMSIIATFQRYTDRLIIVGHRKQTIIGETKIEFTSNSLDLTGKLRNFVCATSDAIGYVHRNKEGNLLISFKPSEELEAGSRCPHLRGQVFPFKWESIYIDMAENRK